MNRRAPVLDENPARCPLPMKSLRDALAAPQIVHGFDCRAGHDPFARHPGAEGTSCPYGCSGDRWFFAVGDTTAATLLTVYTEDLQARAWGLVPDPVDRVWRHNGEPRPRACGADVTLHVSWPTDFSGKTGPCELLGRPCWIPGTSGIDAENLFARYGDPEAGLAQPQSLTVALWDLHAASVASARRRRVSWVRRAVARLGRRICALVGDR